MEQETLENLVLDNRNAGLFRVHRSVFTDPRILDLERRRVFEQCWIYAGHTSEIPQPGDFRTRRVAGRPLILVRGGDGVVRVLLNTCTHRGAQVCRESCGNTKASSASITPGRSTPTVDSSACPERTPTALRESRTSLFIVADNIERIRSRVNQLMGKAAWAENPPSRTRRLISNVRILATDGETVRVAANFIVYRMRVEQVDTYVGRYEYTLVRGDGALRIRHRRAILDLEALRPHGKVSIIL